MGEIAVLPRLEELLESGELEGLRMAARQALGIPHG